MNTDANIAVTDFILAIYRWIMSCRDAWAVGWFGEYCYAAYVAVTRVAVMQ